MGVMTTSHAAIPKGRPFTVADLAAMPADGNRYELIDGVLVVTPAPGRPHQETAATAYVVLRGACPFPVTVVPARLLGGLRP